MTPARPVAILRLSHQTGSETVDDTQGKYMSAVAEQKEAYDRLITACEHIVLLADMLQTEPNNIEITGIVNALGIPKAAISFNAINWPNPATINNALSEYHSAISKINTAWTNVMFRNLEAGLQPPDHDPWESIRSDLRSMAKRRPR